MPGSILGQMYDFSKFYDQAKQLGRDASEYAEAGPREVKLEHHHSMRRPRSTRRRCQSMPNGWRKAMIKVIAHPIPPISMVLVQSLIEIC